MDFLEDALRGMMEKAKTDPVFFINTFCYTFNPKKEPYHFRFKLFPFQKDLVNNMVNHIDHGEDLFVEKSRELGVTYTAMALFLWYWLFIPGSNFLIGSRKESYVDNRRGGMAGNKEESLFGKLDYMLSKFPPFLIPEGFNRDKHFTFMNLVNPANGNVIAGESSNQNFSRGGRQKAIFLDEFAFWEYAEAVWRATADTTNCRLVVTTANKVPSKAKRLRYGKDGEEIDVLTLPYNLDPRKDEAWLDRERKRRSTEDFSQEIMIDWESDARSSVYPEIDHAVTGNYPFLPNVPLYVSWDFGLDGTALTFWQYNQESGRYRLIDAFEYADHPIQFSFPLFGAPLDSQFTYSDEQLAAIKTISGYPKGTHFGDPDVAKRSILTGSSTRKELQKINVYVMSMKSDFIVRREKTKVFLQQGIEVNLHPRTEYFLECVKQSRYPSREESSEATTPIVKPIHNWTSHFRTSLEYFAINIERITAPVRTQPTDHGPRRWRTSRRSMHG